MTNYELMFIIDPALEEEAKAATVEAVKGIIETEGEVIGEADVWGMRKLAYPIRKKSEGYYVVIEFQAPPTLPKELDRRLKISDNIMRHMIVNKDEK
ncbi:MAG: 30S ribosomal protein S6 [Firmicutes bacterium]|nr:30S ribosomal protein S6 [Bacillota bacterium]MBQ9016576.1 30S ribosomal protein S6 [Bacillota bacterium]